MKTTVFDLIWKLKHALEKQGHERIDLSRFTHEKGYRKEILLNVDITDLPISKALQKIYSDLLSADELDLSKEVELPPETLNAKKTTQSASDDKAPLAQVSLEKNQDKSRSYAPILISITLLAIMLLGFEIIQFSNNMQTNQSAPLAMEHAHSKPIAANESTPNASVKQVIAPSVSLQPTTDPIESVDSTQVIQEVATATHEQAAPAASIAFRIQGSNTIGETLAPALIKAFYLSKGASSSELISGNMSVENTLKVDFNTNGDSLLVPIKAHGSSTGFKALDKGDTELAMSSRRIKDREVETLTPLYGNLRSKNTEHIVGMDGLAVIINPNNPIQNLSTVELAKIFSGNITNWKELGGRDETVKVFARDENSGTWDSFKSMILKKHGVNLTNTAKRIESSVELSDNVSKTSGAIGFIGLPYVLRAKALAVSDGEHGLPIFPTSFTISTEDYPLVRRLYIYEPNTISTQSDAHEFINFVLSEEGQNVVKKAGFVSQNIYPTTPVLTNTLPDQYIHTVKNAQRLSLNFRFKSGTFVLDNKAARDLERVIYFFENNPGHQAMLIGFSDSIGEETGNRNLSLQRAKAVEKALLARGINIQQTVGLGEIAPIASNLTKVGRERNRRVEIWVNSHSAQAFSTALR